jgi:DNA-binding NarL/FixJ family response regulator
MARRATRARIMVVDDDVRMTALARQLLEGDGYEVVDHQRWEDAHSRIRQQRIDLVLLDLRFEPGEMGWRVIDKLRFDACTHSTPIILWSSAVEVLEARGPALLADDQVWTLAKPLGLDALSALVGRVLDHRKVASRRRYGSSHTATVGLTRREQAIARLVACGYSNKAVAAELVITKGTVANHVAHILMKLGLANRAQLAVWVAGHGLVEHTSSMADFLTQLAEA